MADLIVEDLMTQAHTETLRLTADGSDLTTPVLVFIDGTGHLEHLALGIPNVHPATAMRAILTVSRASRAAICFEGWSVTTKPTAEEADAWKRDRTPPDFIKKHGRPKDHPDRVEILTLLGQKRGEPVVHRSWRMVRTPGQPTHYDPVDLTDVETAPSNFVPLFTMEDHDWAAVFEIASRIGLRRRASPN